MCLTRCLPGVLLFSFLNLNGLSQTGKDGSETITAAGVIFNRYDNLAASATVGSTTITVSNIANLAGSAIGGAANNPYTTDALGTGDLLMIIKMQGATITTVDAASYGTISAYNNTGVYEIVNVSSVAGNAITVCSALSNTYVVSGTQRVQVVRIPRLSSLTINSGASLTGLAWGSAFTGGIVAIEVDGDAVIDGSISANGIGFRGGALDAGTAVSGVSSYATANNNQGAEKGESIAGYQSDLGVGIYGRGAPANGGGGGCAHNAGGGGGANAGTGTWTGNGNPDLSGTNWNVAWDLEGGSFSASSSSGGGRGGYTYSLNNRNAMLPNAGANQWQGDDRRNVGGLGGRPLTYSSNTLFMGGGGGAGDQNNNAGSPGGRGGGIVCLNVTGTLSGSGSITANGNAASNTITGTGSSPHNDAAGGGGGGGAIKLDIQGAISGVSVSADGGKGGDNLIPVSYAEAYGPGGGGGGGYIAVTGTPSITTSVTNGANGITTSGGLTEFIPNGATRGAAGTIATGLSYAAIPNCTPLAVAKCFDIIPAGTAAIQINWTVYNETDLLKYEVEQSTSVNSWKVVGIQVPQAGANTGKKYSLTIARPSENTYYRIKSIDRNGSCQYSCMKLFRSSTKNISVNQSNGHLYVTHSGTAKGFSVFNSFGKPMKINVHRASSSSSVINITHLPLGLYYLQVVTADEKMVHEFMRF